MHVIFDRLEWENQARTIVSCYFRPAVGDLASNRPYRYEAGQYAVVTVPHTNPDSRGYSRTMTLSSSPSQESLKITFKTFGPSGSSFKRALLALLPGDAVTIDDGMGDLVLPLDPAVPLVFVAGGVGIASYVGMIQYLLDTNDKRDITLFYCVGSTQDIVLQQPFDEYMERFGLIRFLYATDTSGAQDFKGEVVSARLDAAAITQHTTRGSLLYLSGPEIMVDQLRAGLRASGVSHQQIVFDYFEGYTSL